MNPESLRSPESPKIIPEILLTEGPDFYDDAELYGKISDKLIELNHDPAEVLLCGHANETSEDRETTFAMTFDEIAQQTSYAEWTPYNYAKYECLDDGRVAISVYDGTKLRQRLVGAGEYETLDGSSVDTALILRARLLLEV